MFQQQKKHSKRKVINSNSYSRTVFFLLLAYMEARQFISEKQNLQQFVVVFFKMI